MCKWKMIAVKTTPGMGVEEEENKGESGEDEFNNI
jgi:hypothetical protein